MKSIKKNEYEILNRLIEVIKDRKLYRKENSYVSKLFESGQDLILRKISEESLEIVLASKSFSSKEIAHEVSDLLFHILILIEYHGINFNMVLKELTRREGVSGIDEKKDRSK